MPTITPIAKPTGQPGIGNTSQSSDAAQSARERAIAMLTGKASQAAETTQEIPGEVLHAQSKANVSNEVQKDNTEETTETPKEPAKAEAKEESEAPLSSQYAILARKEKAYRAKVQQQEAAFKQREAEIAARESAVTSKDSEYQSSYISKQRLKEDLMSVLAEEGIGYDQVTELALQAAQSTVDPQTKATINKMARRIEELEGKVTTQDKQREEQSQTSYKQALNQIELDATELVNSDASFETIKETKSVKEVVKLIERTFQEDGYVMSVEQAAQMVEDELMDRIIATARIKKIQEKLQPRKEATKQESKPAQQTQMRTLTNAVGTSRKLTARERAILAFENKLSK